MSLPMDGKPMMTDEDILLIKKELLNLKTGTDSVNILEWGSGYSTRVFSEFLTDNGISYNWYSVEYDIDWYEFCESWNMPDVYMNLFKEENVHDKHHMREIPMDGYVNYPLARDCKYDLIIIDGRKRRRCLLNAKKVLADGGSVLLHDAEREEYHCAMKGYKGEFLSEQLWKGTL